MVDTHSMAAAFSHPNWRTSSYSAQQGDCVEIAHAAGAVAVRDSKNRATGHLTASSCAWAAFVTGAARAGARSGR